jgi:dolichol-phosphate mannosyltransferase
MALEPPVTPERSSGVQMPRPADPLITIVVPVYNEEKCVKELADRVHGTLESLGVRYELLFIDDGSTDGTAEGIASLRKSNPSVKSVHFTRSFGHQAALVAGLHFAHGDATITMDGDLQHPPEFLPRLVTAWREGADVVNTVRHEVPGAQPFWKEPLANLFYSLMGRLSGARVIPGGADFRLLDRRVVDAFKSFGEHFVFVRGLVPWLGFPDACLEYDVESRYAGSRKYSARHMIRLALDGIFSFSIVPLRIITLLGLATTVFGIGFGIFALLAFMTGSARLPGWTSIIVLVLVFGGIQLLAMGTVSEYIGRIYEEIKRRPRYVISRLEGIEWP